MVSELKNHRFHGLNDTLVVEARDNPGVDGACHLYRITALGARKDGTPQVIFPDIRFQDGNVDVVGGVNGYSDEVLLAVVIHRLQGFQTGKYACEENENALISLDNAMLWLKKRVVAFQHKQFEDLAKLEKPVDKTLPTTQHLNAVPVAKETKHASRSHDRKNRKQG